jgi:hypothetical protein
VYWIIELLNTGRRTFVESFSNAHAVPRATFSEGQAKPFSSREEAEGWAKHYLPAYSYTVVSHRAG